MLIDYFNGCVRAQSVGIAAQIKIMREPSSVIYMFMVHHLSLVAFRRVQNRILEEEII
jgi:hypothetical protein